MPQHPSARLTPRGRETLVSRIEAALAELIGEKGFEELTVSDLTRRAGINRGTLYLHHVDKYDLLDQLEGEVMARLEEILLSGGDGRSADVGGQGAARGGVESPEQVAAMISQSKDRTPASFVA